MTRGLVLLLDNANEGSLFAENLVLQGYPNLFFRRLMSAIAEQRSGGDLPESEVGGHFFEVLECERQVDWRVRQWVFLAGKFQLGILQFIFVESNTACDQLVAEDFSEVSLLCAE